ncbi:hypothetical protein NL676_001173 [Syzygium grande]|nr:hypothetical protein NL676_001173 [Syzygium grande]
MEDFGSKKRRLVQPVAALAKKRKKQQWTMAGNAPVQCPRPCSVKGKDDPKGQNRHCFDGSEKVMKARTAQLAMIYDNVSYPDVERTLRAEKLKQRFAGVILKAKLLIHGEADVQEKPASTRPAISSGILRQTSSIEKLASRPAISSGILQQRSSVEKPASRPVIRSGILQQRSSVKTELRRELERKREAARTKVGSMNQTADLVENLDALKELKRVFGHCPWVMEAFHGARRENPLEKLGLFLKDASVDEDIEADLLDREGEIYRSPWFFCSNCQKSRDSIHAEATNFLANDV